MSKCNNSKCSTSTGICGNLTFGWGDLNDYGYWEHPCEVCKKAQEEAEKNPRGYSYSNDDHAIYIPLQMFSLNKNLHEFLSKTPGISWKDTGDFRKYSLSELTFSLSIGRELQELFGMVYVHRNM